jgi:peptidoglycan/LPS O-acetylase OafA/YrhL
MTADRQTQDSARLIGGTSLPAEPVSVADSEEWTGSRAAPSLDEAGTPPEDRRFRPDIEGLRAIAVVLVVLAHSGVGFLSSGFIGVDVFFVISGYVITGLLLRECSATGRIHILPFYGRRVRRIIPAALFVIVVTVVAERLFVGTLAASDASGYGRLAALFVANLPTYFHATTRGSYESPFAAYWSLSVEEQFYLVYPLLVLISLLFFHRLSVRLKLGLLLGISAMISFGYSVALSPGAGFLFTYTSPLTRAWELAVGGLVAVGGAWTTSLPPRVAAALSWIGLGAILAAAHYLSGAGGGYPGYIAAWPVLAAALLIVGGSSAPPQGAEWLLKRWPFKWLGRWSYSLYLWHYPILVLAAERWGPLSVTWNLVLMVLAVAISAGSYFAIENPIRHSSYLIRTSWASIALGACLMAAALALLGAFR